jgi:hypothetical protein
MQMIGSRLVSRTLFLLAKGVLRLGCALAVRFFAVFLLVVGAEGFLGRGWRLAALVSNTQST